MPRGGYALTRDGAYGPLPRQKLDVYRPRNGTSPAGVVVFFYGGDWQNGSKADYRFVGQALASRGFVAVLADYRLYPQVTFPAFVEDGAMAVRWAHSHLYESGPLFLMGHSAGAHVAALLTLDEHYLRDAGLAPGAVRAAALLSGPFDFIPPPRDQAVFSMRPGDLLPPPGSQPIRFARGDAPPVLLVQGESDAVVRPHNTVLLAERLTAAGATVRTVFYPDTGHAGVVLALAWPFRWYAPTLCDVTAFFRSHAALTP